MPNCDLAMNNDLGKDLDFETLDKFFEENHFNVHDLSEHWERQTKTPEQFGYTSDHVISTPPINWSTQRERDEERYPVQLRPLSPSDVENILRSSSVHSDDVGRQHAHVPVSFSHLKAMNEIDSLENFEDNLEKESLTDSCLFVSADGNEVFTCSFPDYSTPQNNSKQNGKSTSEGSHLIFDKPPPPYSEVTDHLSKTNKTSNSPLRIGQHGFVLDSGLMNGKFRPRCADILRYQQDFLPNINETFLQRRQPTPQNFFQQDQLQQHHSAAQIHQQQLHQNDLNVTSIHQSIREPKKRRHSMSRTSSPQRQNGDHYYQQQLNDSPKKLLKASKTQNWHVSSSETAEDNRNHRDVSMRRSHTEEQLTKYNSPNTISSETTYGTSPGESLIPPPFVRNPLSAEQVENESDSRCAIEWFPYKNRTWFKLFSGDCKEITVLDFRATADKGFNFSSTDDVFVCQRKNHFQVTVNFNFSHLPRLIQVEDALLPLEYLSLNFYGIKAECESHIVPIEQSESDRSKHLLQPVKISLNDLRGSSIRVVVGRLHFGETTLNNMRKRGKPNPDQKYFRLVVCLSANIKDDADMINKSTELRFPVVIHASDKIVVRATNPSLFESDSENVWIKGKNMDSICHYGNVGINTKSPAEALTVHGNLKITGQILDPSDARIKTDIREMNTKEQLKNITQINVYQFRYLPSYEEYAGLKRSTSNDPLHRHKKLSSETPKVGIVAQQVSQILPDAVHVVGDVVLPDGRVLEGFLVVNKDRIFIEGLGAVKELCKVTDRLERRINRMEEVSMNLVKYNKEQICHINPNNTNDWKVAAKFPRNVDDLSALSDGSLTISRPPTNLRTCQITIKQKLSNFFKNKWAAIGFVIVMTLVVICSIVGLTFGVKSSMDHSTKVSTTTTSLKPTCGRSDAAFNSKRCPPILIWPNCTSFSSCQSIQCCSGSFETYVVIIKENDEDSSTKSQIESFPFVSNSTFVMSTSETSIKSENNSDTTPNDHNVDYAGKHPVPHITGILPMNSDPNIFTSAYDQTTILPADNISNADIENVTDGKDGVTVDLSSRQTTEITSPAASEALGGEITQSFFSFEEKLTQIYTSLENKSFSFKRDDMNRNDLNPPGSSNLFFNNFKRFDPKMNQTPLNGLTIKRTRKPTASISFNSHVTTSFVEKSTTKNKVAFDKSKNPTLQTSTLVTISPIFLSSKLPHTNLNLIPSTAPEANDNKSYHLLERKKREVSRNKKINFILNATSNNIYESSTSGLLQEEISRSILLDANYFNEMVEKNSKFTTKINRNFIVNNFINFNFNFNSNGKNDAENNNNENTNHRNKNMKEKFPPSGDDDDDDDDVTYNDINNFPHIKTHTILLPQFNLTLTKRYCNNKACMDGQGLSRNYLITVAANFPTDQNIDVQFTLSPADGLVLCSWGRRKFCSNGIEKLPQFDKKSMRWNLPVGSYLTSNYEFLVYDKIQERDYSCIKSQDRRSFQLKFHRQCSSDDQQPL